MSFEGSRSMVWVMVSLMAGPLGSSAVLQRDSPSALRMDARYGHWVAQPSGSPCRKRATLIQASVREIRKAERLVRTSNGPPYT